MFRKLYLFYIPAGLFATLLAILAMGPIHSAASRIDVDQSTLLMRLIAPEAAMAKASLPAPASASSASLERAVAPPAYVRVRGSDGRVMLLPAPEGDAEI